MMKKTEQNIQKMSDNQYHMEHKIITMLSKMEETQLKIIEVLSKFGHRCNLGVRHFVYKGVWTIIGHQTQSTTHSEINPE